MKNDHVDQFAEFIRMRQREPIKVSLPVIRDSDNSYPRDQLVFEFDEGSVTIYLDAIEARKVTVPRDVFEKMLIMMGESK